MSTFTAPNRGRIVPPSPNEPTFWRRCVRCGHLGWTVLRDDGYVCPLDAVKGAEDGASGAGQPGEPLIEWCRECCGQEPPRAVVAEFVLWGKLFPPEALGPRCYEHAAAHIGWQGMGRINQYAVLDLRHLWRCQR